MQKAATWMLEHIKGSGGLGAIYPAMANVDRGSSVPRLSGRRPIGAEGAPRIESPEVYDMVSIGEQRGRSAASSALPLSNLGYGIVHERPSSKPGCRRITPSLQKARSLLWSLAKRKRLAIGSSRLPMRNREAGTSSSRTSSIPM